MIITMMKAYSPKFRPKLVNYSDFKKFLNEVFRDELLTNLCNGTPSYDNFLKMVNRVLDKHAPQKKKVY